MTVGVVVMVFLDITVTVEVALALVKVVVKVDTEVVQAFTAGHLVARRCTSRFSGGGEAPALQ